MQLFRTLEKPLTLNQSAVLTIGNFDGVHLGHQTILNKVKELSKVEQLLSAVITFKNHPSWILNPNQPTHLLTTPEQKIKLLESLGIDIVVMIDFDQKFSNLSADDFLEKVSNVLPFRYLILGYDAKLGKDRKGDADRIQEIAKKNHFCVDYIPAFSIKGKPVSSSTIRKCISEDDLKTAEELLGRPYSIYGKILAGQGNGKQIGFPTANMDVSTLCIPPFGVYAVKVLIEGKAHSGVANLGFAPTVRSDHKPLLEVHLFDAAGNIYERFAEVIFEEFIRPERRFENIELLKKQIAEDVVEAKKILGV